MGAAPAAQLSALVRGMLKAKGKTGRKMMFHSAQRVPLQPDYSCRCGGYSRGRDSVLEVLAGCSSLDAALCPGGVWLTPDQLRTGSPLCVLLCSPAWRLDPCVDPGQVQGHLLVLVQRSERNRQKHAENSALFANVANPSAELDFITILQVTQQPQVCTFSGTNELH